MAPVFRPTAAEFQDPMRYLASLPEAAAAAGLVKIIPPEGWRPTFSHGDMSMSRPFPTRLQRVHRFQEGVPFDDVRGAGGGSECLRPPRAGGYPAGGVLCVHSLEKVLLRLAVPGVTRASPHAVLRLPPRPPPSTPPPRAGPRLHAGGVQGAGGRVSRQVPGGAPADGGHDSGWGEEVSAPLTGGDKETWLVRIWGAGTFSRLPRPVAGLPPSSRT